jgi:hypothetical protein
MLFVVKHDSYLPCIMYKENTVEIFKKIVKNGFLRFFSPGTTYSLKSNYFVPGTVIYVKYGFLYLILTRCTFTVYILFKVKGDQMLTIA